MEDFKWWNPHQITASQVQIHWKSYFEVSHLFHAWPPRHILSNPTSTCSSIWGQIVWGSVKEIVTSEVRRQMQCVWNVIFNNCGDLHAVHFTSQRLRHLLFRMCRTVLCDITTSDHDAQVLMKSVCQLEQYLRRQAEGSIAHLRRLHCMFKSHYRGTSLP